MPQMVKVPKKEYEKLKRIEREVRMKKALDNRREGDEELVDPEEIEVDDSNIEVKV